MASQIQLTRSGTPGAQPTATEMELGELALNYADGKLYFKNDSNNIELLNSMSNMSGQKIIVNEGDNHIGLNTTSPNFLLDLGGTPGHADNTLRINQTTGGTAIRIGSDGVANGEDITLLRVDNADGETNSSAEGFAIKYLGTNPNNELGIFADNGSSELQALTILQNGNIGIGTGAPAVALHVKGDLRVDDTDDSPTLTYDSSTNQLNTTGATFEINKSNGVDVAICDNAVYVDSSTGNTGIGNNAPGEKLDVTGNIAVAGTIAATGNISSNANVSATVDITADNDITAGGDITATGNAIAAEPTADTHLTTKAYVDNTYQPGEIVQQFYHRIDAVKVFGIHVTDGKLSASTYRTPGQTGHRIIDTQGLNFISGSGGTARSLYAMNLTDFEISITPKYANSLIVVEYNICGETGNQDTGLWMGEANSDGDAQVITRSGYEGYNPNAPVGYNNSYFSNFYQGNDDSTLLNHIITYIDKPNTTSQKTYIPIYHSIHNADSNREFHLNRTVSLSAQYNYEYGVSNMSIKEIRQ